MRPRPTLMTALQAAVFALTTTVVPAQGEAELPTNTPLAKAIVAEELELDTKRALDSYEQLWKSAEQPDGVRRHAAMRFALLGRRVGADSQRIEAARAFAVGNGDDDPTAVRMKAAWANDQREAELAKMVAQLEELQSQGRFAAARTMGPSIIPALVKYDLTRRQRGKFSNSDALGIVWATPGPLAAAAIDAGLQSEAQVRWVIATGRKLEYLHPDHFDRIVALLSDPNAKPASLATVLGTLQKDRSGRVWSIDPVIELLNHPGEASPRDGVTRYTTVRDSAAQYLQSRALVEDFPRILEKLVTMVGNPLWTPRCDELLANTGLATVAGRKALLERAPVMAVGSAGGSNVNTTIQVTEPPTAEEHALLVEQLQGLGSAPQLYRSLAFWYLLDIGPEDAELAIEAVRLQMQVNVGRLATGLPGDRLEEVLDAFPETKRGRELRQEFLRSSANRKSLPASLWPKFLREIEADENLLNFQSLGNALAAFGTDEAVTWTIEKARREGPESVANQLLIRLLRARPEDERLKQAVVDILAEGGGADLLICAALRGFSVKLKPGSDTKGDYAEYLERLLMNGPDNYEEWVLNETERKDARVRWSEDQMVDVLLAALDAGGKPFAFESFAVKEAIDPKILSVIRRYFDTVAVRTAAGDERLAQINWFSRAGASGDVPGRVPALIELKHELRAKLARSAPIATKAFSAAVFTMTKDGFLGTPHAKQLLSELQSPGFDTVRAAWVLGTMFPNGGPAGSDWRPSKALATRVLGVLAQVDFAYHHGLAKAVNRLEDQSTRIELLSIILRDSISVKARTFVCQELARTGSELAAEPLVDALFDKDLNVQTAAREALDILRLARTERARWERIRSGAEELDPEVATQKLFVSLAKSDDAEERTLILRSLGAVAPPPALPKLLELRKSEAMKAQRKTIDTVIEQILARSKGE